MSTFRRFHITKYSIIFHLFLVEFILLLEHQIDGLIITSVIAGNKKFKTVSFDSKFLKPLTFESDLPSTEFRRHRTLRPPKFDIDVNIPIRLPIEEEYPQPEHKKPVESNFFFQTGEINEPNYEGKKIKQGKKMTYKDEYASATNQNEQQTGNSNEEGISPSELMSQGIKGLLPTLAKSIKFHPKIETFSNIQAAPPVAPPVPAKVPAQVPAAPQRSIARSDYKEPAPMNKEPDFVPGGFVNLQLSGPSGGPQMTYEDFDREKWAEQLSQTPGAMPYPILNYHQLQNYYGGLGTFTNGLAEHRYVEHSLLEKFKSSLNLLANKFHLAPTNG